MDSLCRVRNKIMYVLLCRTVYALTRVLFWCSRERINSSPREYIHYSLYLSLWPSDICVGNLTIIGSGIGLTPGRRQAIIWINAEILLFGPLGTNLSENVITFFTFSLKKIHLKMSCVTWRPFCLGLNVLSSMKMCIPLTQFCHSGTIYASSTCILNNFFVGFDPFFLEITHIILHCHLPINTCHHQYHSVSSTSQECYGGLEYTLFGT